MLAGFGEVPASLERERDHYEMKATAPEEQRVKVRVDPFTGDVIDTEVERGN